MFEILAEWFGQSISIPVVVCDLFFLAIGIFAAVKVKNKKSVIYIMLTIVILYFAAVLVSQGTNYMLAIFSVFVGGLTVLALVGACIGLVIRSVKKF